MHLHHLGISILHNFFTVPFLIHVDLTFLHFHIIIKLLYELPRGLMIKYLSKKGL